METKLKSDIVKAAESIRKKYKLLKEGIVQEDIDRKKHFEPLLKPLTTLIDLTGDKSKDLEELKVSIKESGEEVAKKIKAVDRKIKTQPRSKEKGTSTGYYEDIYDDPGEAEDAWNEWHDHMSRFGPLTRKYLYEFTFDKSHHFDTKFGVHAAPDRSFAWQIGYKDIDFDKSDDIHIDHNVFYGTRGLFELIFKRFPDNNIYNTADLETYKKILELTNAHLQGWKSTGNLASSNSSKYKQIISKLFMNKSKDKSGGSLLPVNNNTIDYLYWDNPNELVERLALLKASEAAGNYAHLAEIASIEEELREGKFIL
ncbi:unnamed protein product [Bemisia tabaci]|uniref:DUF8207 domain-containing protein n=1 Tax=Bemisia tabaci TaxID=7038 RepID=A0A9P0ACB0_BEMTA|nr:unnamed protein product [Bemisia tabaci]